MKIVNGRVWSTIKLASFSRAISMTESVKRIDEVAAAILIK